MSVVRLHNIRKEFNGVSANEGVCFDLEAGEIHALLGENGAGKTTLMNILYGIYSCDEGEIFIDEKKVEIDNPRTAIGKGVSMVHQHFMLIPQLSVAQNIFLGMRETGFFLDLKDLERKVVEISARFGFKVDPRAYVWQLPVGVQQKVEILKALVREARVLILDEPTAVLTPLEVDELFASIKVLANNGFSVILITHKIEEVMRHCDRVTVMREGRIVDTKAVGETSLKELAHMMVGRDVCLDRAMAPNEPGEVLLKVEDLVVRDGRGLKAVDGVSFEIRAGEVLGFVGVDGNGQLELGEAISGLRKREGGSIEICGELVGKASPREIMRRGLSHIPEDRQRKGLVLPFSISENILLGSQREARFRLGPILDYSRIGREAAQLVESFDIRPRDGSLAAEGLSGGNQQKVILAREMTRPHRILLALQPTRGLDVGAIEFVRRKIAEERDRGNAVMLVSTDIDEILSLSDRIAVLYRGRILSILGWDADIERIGLLMGGIEERAEHERA
jgi:simple sugar transport system ATP-binding protein